MAIIPSHILKPLFLQRRKINSWALSEGCTGAIPGTHWCHHRLDQQLKAELQWLKQLGKDWKSPVEEAKWALRERAALLSTQSSRGPGAWLLLSLLPPLTLHCAPRLIPRERRRAGEPQFKVQPDLASSISAFFNKNLFSFNLLNFRFLQLAGTETKSLQKGKRQIYLI